MYLLRCILCCCGDICVIADALKLSESECEGEWEDVSPACCDDPDDEDDDDNEFGKVSLSVLSIFLFDLFLDISLLRCCWWIGTMGFISSIMKLL